MADDSASSKGVSRGDTSGTKGSGGTSKSGNSSGVGGGGGGGGGSTGSRGSSTGGVGAGNGSNAAGNKGGGGQGGQNSGVGRDSSRGLGQGAGGSAIGRGNTSGVGGPGGGGGMGGQNVRNGSSTSPVGPKSGYSAPGNIGGGKSPTTGQQTGGISRQTAGINDRMEGIKTQIDSSVSRGLNPNLGPRVQDIRDPQAARPYSAPPGSGPRDDRAPTVASKPSVAVPRAANMFDLRGVTGPLGEPRWQATPYGTNYQTAQMMRDMYPDRLGQYSQERVTNALNTNTKAYPGEANLNVNGNIPNVMHDLARVGINQMVGGYKPERTSFALDTTGLDPKRSAVRGLENPGPNSMGMTENWADKEAGIAAQTRASMSLQDALFGRGVSPEAEFASNFAAAGTPLSPGVKPIGSPVNGTQFGNDPNWGGVVNGNTVDGGRVRDRSEAASLAMNRENLERDTAPDVQVRPASESYDDRFRAKASGSWTSPYDRPGATAALSVSDDPQTYTSVQGGLGMSPFNATPREERLVTTGAPAKNFSGKGLSPSKRDDRYYGGAWKTEASGPDFSGARHASDLRSIPQADDGTWGDRDDRDPLGNWYADPTPADDEERILQVEDVPEYISPTPQMPPPTPPETPRAWKVAEKAPYVGPIAKGLRMLGAWEYDRLDEQGRADLMEKWANQNHDYLHGGNLEGSKQEPLDLFGVNSSANNAYIPKGTGAPPPPPDDPPDDGTDWDSRYRNPNPIDPYNYGYGPAHQYFYYA